MTQAPIHSASHSTVPGDQANTVLVIIAAKVGELDNTRLGHIIAPIPKAHRGAIKWLAAHTACELPIFPWDGNGEAMAWRDPSDMIDVIQKTVITPARNAEQIDLALVPASNRAKRGLVADMDSTIIEQECIDEIADYAGLKPQIAAITERAMQGELEFDEALRNRVALLKGIPEATLDAVANNNLSLMSGARCLVQTMKTHGAKCALVSGGFTYFTQRIAARVGFDIQQANQLELSNGTITGRVLEPILGRDAKLKALQSLARNNNLTMPDTLAVGDGANDLAMIKAAGLGVAFHAKPVVAIAADVAITHGDLTTLLYVQGYTRQEFTS